MLNEKIEKAEKLAQEGKGKGYSKKIFIKKKYATESCNKSSDQCHLYSWSAGRAQKSFALDSKTPPEHK